MTKPSRRAFLASQACLYCLETAQAAQDSSPGSPKASWPAEVAGIRIVDSKYTKLAAEALLDSSPAFLVNHSLRTFYFGALIGRQKNLSFDAEVFFLACALHDLGLTPKYQGSLPFEIQGAEAARKILSSAGLTSEKTQTVWDGIAMHPLRISDFKPPEISLVGAGAGADVLGGSLNQLPQADVSAVVTAFPRLQFKQLFVRACGETGNKYPGAARGTFMRDIAERTNPAYKVSNICDAISASPFAE